MIYKTSRRDMIQSLFGGIGTFGLAAVMGSQPAKASTWENIPARGRREKRNM